MLRSDALILLGPLLPGLFAHGLGGVAFPASRSCFASSCETFAFTTGYILLGGLAYCEDGGRVCVGVGVARAARTHACMCVLSHCMPESKT